MKQDAISIWVEPNYADTPWCRMLFLGIKSELARCRRKADFVVAKEPGPHLEKEGLAILAGETAGWIERMLGYAHGAHMRVCMACADPEPNIPYASTVTLDRWGDMCVMMRYFCNADRRRIALFGVNPASPADQKRISAYEDMVRDLDLPVGRDDIYPTLGDVQACTSKILFHIGRYDAVIAGNDLYAVYLLPQLERLGIAVPGHIFVAGFGNTYLSRATAPTLTTAALDHVELGRQVIHMALNLEKNPQVTRMTFTIEGHFYPRESTAGLPISTIPLDRAPAQVHTDISSYSDPHLAQVVNLELCLASCDRTDRTIIEEMIKERTIDRIADSLFLSQSTLNYRLNKLYRQTGVSTRMEFECLLRAYAPGFAAAALDMADGCVN